MSYAPSIDALGMSAQNAVAANVEALGLGYSYDFLSKREFDKWKLGFKRMLIVNQSYRNFVDLDYRHVMDYLLGAMIAKKQFRQEFDGTMPFSGRFGMSRPRASHFGLGDYWLSELNDTASTTANVVTANVENSFIHGGTDALGGTDDYEIKVLESMVAVIVGFGDLVTHIEGLKSPIESWAIKKDGKTLPVLPYEHQSVASDFPIMELDEAIILKNKSTFRLSFFADNTTDQNAECYPMVWGIVYAPEDQLRKKDAANVYGTTNDMLTYTG